MSLYSFLTVGTLMLSLLAVMAPPVFPDAPVAAESSPQATGADGSSAVVQSDAGEVDSEVDSPAPAEQPDGLWLNDYRRGMDQAKAEGKMLFLWFFDPRAVERDAQFRTGVLEADPVQCRLANVVCVSLPLNAQTESHGRTIQVLDHSAFTEMLHQPGIAMVDLTDRQSPHFGSVVSVLPFTKQHPTVQQICVLLDLPPGTLTQRTMTYAVRTHREHPGSAWGKPLSVLAAETESHAAHQATILVQGHHQWDQRFHRINRRLPRGLVANEVCAESWPGQPLVEAAEECVDCWRQSPGHWDHVRRRHPFFGFDIKRGRNGVWYATGIFANDH